MARKAVEIKPLQRQASFKNVRKEDVVATAKAHVYPRRFLASYLRQIFIITNWLTVLDSRRKLHKKRSLVQQKATSILDCNRLKGTILRSIENTPSLKSE
jgi:hypothetical protein